MTETQKPTTDTYLVAGNLLRFLSRSAETGGAYFLVENLAAPGAGAPMNRHPGDDEAFYVVDGTFEFVVDGAVSTLAAGDFVRIPNGAMHAFRNIGAAPGRLIILNTPGLAHESFYAAAGDPMPPGTRALPPLEGAPDVGRIIAAGIRNGIEFAPPPGD